MVNIFLEEHEVPEEVIIPVIEDEFYIDDSKEDNYGG